MHHLIYVDDGFILFIHLHDNIYALKHFLTEIIMGPVYAVSEKTQEKACREQEEDNFSAPWCYFISPDSNIWAQLLSIFFFLPLHDKESGEMVVVWR